MTCRELAELLDDVCDGCCSPQVRVEIEGHLRQCPHCHCYAETYRLTVRWSRQLSPMPPPEGLLERVRAALAQNVPQCDPRDREPPTIV